MTKLDSGISRILLAPEDWTVVVPRSVPPKPERRRRADGITAGSKPASLTVHPTCATVLCPETREPTPAEPVPPARMAWSEQHTHVRSYREILLTVYGTDWFGMGGVLYPCRPGMLFLVEPHVPHDIFYPKTAHNLEHLWFNVFGEFVTVNWVRIRHGRSRRLHERLSVLSSEKLGIALKMFPDPIVALSGLRDIARMRLLVGLITTFLEPQLHAAGRKRDVDKAAVMQQEVVLAIRHHISETAGKGLTLDTLAHFSGYSKFHLHRLFLAQTGCTIHQFINISRMRRMRSLKDSGATNAEITEALGFANTSAFLRWRRGRDQGRA